MLNALSSDLAALATSTFVEQLCKSRLRLMLETDQILHLVGACIAARLLLLFLLPAKYLASE